MAEYRAVAGELEWRVVFVWNSSSPEKVQILDYHS